MSEEFLIGEKQKRQIALMDALKMGFGNRLKVERSGENLKIVVADKTVWINHDFRIVGEAVTPSTGPIPALNDDPFPLHE